LNGEYEYTGQLTADHNNYAVRNGTKWAGTNRFQSTKCNKSTRIQIRPQLQI